MNNNADLEEKMKERMNDIVKAMTKSMADRVETRRSIRLLEKQSKNVFEIMIFLLQGGQGHLQ